MSEGRKFDNATDAMSFLQAGNATITVVSTKTGARYTYRVRESEDGNVFFVSVMFGPDNESQYAYIGILRRGVFMHTTKSKVARDDVRFRAFEWAYGNLAKGQLPDVLEVWHEGKCGRCGRKLTVPESIARGIGPECWSLGGFAATAVDQGELEMQRMEAEGDRAQTIREEENKHAVRRAMEILV